MVQKSVWMTGHTKHLKEANRLKRVWIGALPINQQGRQKSYSTTSGTFTWLEQQPVRPGGLAVVHIAIPRQEILTFP